MSQRVFYDRDNGATRSRLIQDPAAGEWVSVTESNPRHVREVVDTNRQLQDVKQTGEGRLAGSIPLGVYWDWRDEYQRGGACRNVSWPFFLSTKLNNSANAALRLWKGRLSAKE